jgi:hypothetical protein
MRGAFVILHKYLAPYLCNRQKALELTENCKIGY